MSRAETQGRRVPNSSHFALLCVSARVDFWLRPTAAPSRRGSRTLRGFLDSRLRGNDNLGGGVNHRTALLPPIRAWTTRSSVGLPENLVTPVEWVRAEFCGHPCHSRPRDALIRATVRNPKRAGAKIFFMGVGTRTYGGFGGWRDPFSSTDSCNIAGIREGSTEVKGKK